MQVTKYQMITIEDILFCQLNSCLDDKALLIQVVSDFFPYLQEKDGNKKFVFELELQERRIASAYLPVVAPKQRVFNYEKCKVEFRKKFHLENALKVRCEGDLHTIEKKAQELGAFIFNNGYTKITNFYIVLLNISEPADIDFMIADIYVGLSGNII